MLDDHTLKSVLKSYGLDFSRIRPDLPLTGSPQRCQERIVTQDRHGDLYVVEALLPGTEARKESIARTLENLSQAGLLGLAKNLPYAPQKHIFCLNDRFYQVLPYITGQQLPRPQYLDHGWRGTAMAGFLVNLKKSSRQAGLFLQGSHDFSLHDFFHNLVHQLSFHNPEILERIGPALDHARQFSSVLKILPAGFCHGDFHPMNVIWGKNCVNAVIDWEFCGTRPEMYDTALMVGCAGFEYPSAISGSYVEAFLKDLWKSGIYQEKSWDHLFPLMLLIRFAWLSEWLRNRETAMISLELDYLGFLTRYVNHIKTLFASVRRLS